VVGVNGASSNAEAAHEADALLEASAALRRELVVWERQIRQMRARVISGKPNPRPEVVPAFVASRLRVNERFDELEQCRRVWRAAYFRLQADSGMSFGAIARQWGLSRQLVSRLLNDEKTNQPAGRSGGRGDR
jgi:hypothetical protein